MTERTFVESQHFGVKLKIHGHLSHDMKPGGDKTRWFVYMVEDNPCGKQYVGSSINVPSRWSAHKHSANFPEGKDPLNKKTPTTGLAKHFQKGCPYDRGPTKHTLSLTLLDYYDVSSDSLSRAGHKPGAACRCKECNALKDIEDKWILKVGSCFGKSGLNERCEVVNKTRFDWKKQRIIP